MKSTATLKECIEGFENEIERILRFCFRHPLALSVVGKAIESHRKFPDELAMKDALGEYLEELKDSLSDDGGEKAQADGYQMPYAGMCESLVVIRRQRW